MLAVAALELACASQLLAAVPLPVAPVPVSHCSPGSTLPLPHFFWQVASHALEGAPLFAPSSQASPLLIVPSPQRAPSLQLVWQWP